MEIIKEIPPNDDIVRAKLYNQYWKVIDPPAINLNSKGEVLSDRRSSFPIKSLRINGLGKPFRLQIKGIAKV